MNLSVVIASRNDPWLSRTVGNLLSECAVFPEIIVVQDAGVKDSTLPGHVVQLCPPTPLGTSGARDYGVRHASCDNILSIDAHMDFTGERDALIRLVDELAQAERQVLCCRMAALTGGETLVSRKNKELYWGAAVIPERLTDQGEHIALKCHWNRKGECGEIAGVMGAGYAFRKDWYLHGMNAPWEIGRGYGMDEETLSLVNWICGGVTRLVDIPMGHYFNTGQHFAKDHEYLADVWVNRIRLVMSLPMSDRLRNRLMRWLDRNRIDVYRPQIKRRLAELDGSIKSTLSFLESTGRTVNDFIDYWLDRDMKQEGGKT
jgi:glycosyltransferase involved in cell wall biosynthesis